MTIRTSRNLDEIKPGGLALLTKRQILYSVITLVVTLLVTVVATILGANLTIAGYIGLIVAAPIGYVGFFKRNGMTLPEYRQAKKNVNQPMLFYDSTENPKTAIVCSNPADMVQDQKGFVDRMVSRMMEKKRKESEKPC
ncbi:MAG: PrgI family protein [Lachnospiraceae bacterium]|nr:PrgI family protein [Lachnospiraceae bacterium]